MRSSSLLFSFFRFLVVPSVLFTSFLYLYPAALNCGFPLVQKATAQCMLDNGNNNATAKAHAPFRLLVLADPQLEGDSSLPDPNDPYFPSMAAFSRTPHNSIFSDVSGLVKNIVNEDIPRIFQSGRKRLDLFGNDWYLAHIYRTMHWWTKPTHVVVLGDLIGSQWVSDEEFDRRAWRYWNRAFRGAKKVPDAYMNSAGLVQQPLGQDSEWPNYLINIAGNHDIGYAGDINEERMSRFVSYYGKPNYQVHFQRANTSQSVFSPFDPPRDEPEIRLIILNSMNLDNPTQDERLQSETYDFINHELIKNSRPVEDRTSFNIILTHIPLYKPEGVCIDGPLFTFHESGIKEQNHLSEDISKSFLEGILGMSPNIEAPAAGRGRPGLILNGHDHEGCDTYHFVSSDGNGGDRAWAVERWIRSASQKPHDLPGVREITMRSMMGSYGGFAGMLSVWFDNDLNEWQYDFATCMLGVQHIWWAIHALDVITLVVLCSAVVVWLVDSLQTPRNPVRTHAPAVKTPVDERPGKKLQ